MSIQLSGSVIVGTPTNPPSGVSLVSLTDVNISAPATGQVLTYNAGGLVWQNQSIGTSTYSYLTTNLLEGPGVDLTFTPGSPGSVTISATVDPEAVVEALGYEPVNSTGDTISGAYNFSNGTISNLTSLDFTVLSSAPAFVPGRVFYLGGTDQTLCYYNDEADVLMNIGQETWIRVRNISGSTIAIGVPVYITGVNSGLPTIALANANSISTANVIGISLHGIENNTNGYVMLEGLIKGIDTSAFTTGVTTYLGTSAGSLTQTAPTTPNLVVPIGTAVTINSTTGSILVNTRSFLKAAVNTNIVTAGGITATNVQQAIYDLDTDKLARSGSQAMTGDLSMGTHKITNVVDPTNPQDVATMAWVNASIVGNTPLQSVQLATAAALPTCTASGTGVGKTLTASANGALTVDGTAVVNGNRILVKNQSGSGPDANNGVYLVTAAGSGGAPFILTRTTDFDQAAEVITGATTFVENGTANSSTSWTLITPNPITVDTTPLQFILSSRADAIIAGAGLDLTISTLSVNFGAGIMETPTDNVGVDCHASGGIFTTVDNSTQSTVAASQLAIRLDSTTLSKSSSGLKVSTGGITSTELAASVAGAGLIGGAGTALAVGTTSSTRIVINSNDIDLATTGISAANYNVVGIDAYGRATSGFLRTLTAPSAGISVTNGSGVAGNPTLALADDLLALENLATVGISVRTGTGAWTTRTITATGTGISITNADGVAGNISVVSNATTANTASTLVARDASGNFSAGTITATLNGASSSASSAPWGGISGKPTTLGGYGITDALATYGGNVTSGQLVGTRTINAATGGGAAFMVQNNAGTGDGNVAMMQFLCQSQYGINLYLRADGYFGLGGWSRPVWSWYTDPSGNMTTAGDVTAYSDPRLKKNVKTLYNALDKVLKLDGVTFTWIEADWLAKSGTEDTGVLADQVKEVMPHAVKPGMEHNGIQYDMVAYDKLIPLLIESIKELNAKVEDLKSQLATKE